ncbi:kinase-like domain-containing protein [Thamnidium elegans]|nr:kinase-like domain-containing protein [Thamnidium elegans]
MSIVNVLGYLRGANTDSQYFLATLPLGKTFGIGSDPNCDIIIDMEYISPYHCIIQSRVENGVSLAYLTDISLNGTYLNGDLIGYNQTVILYPSCVISFVSHYLNLFYIQAHGNETNDQYEEDFLVPLRSDEIEHENRCMISVTNRQIGVGTQSEVFLCNIVKRLRFQLACKRHRKKYFWGLGSKALKTELSILESNKHQNVLSVISWFERNNDMYSFCPLYFGGNLQDRIDRPYDIKEEDAFFIYYQISSGLTYLHKNGIIHCDLKPNNILLENYDEKTRIVISDFGLSIKAKDINYWPDDYGTFAYHAPEIIEQKPIDEKVDIWALGIIVYEMLTKQHPFVNKYYFESETRSEIITNILEKEPDMSLLQSMTEHARNVIKELLSKDPKLRKSGSQTLWAQDHMDSFFYQEILNVRKSFIRERSMWFNGEVLKETESETTYHPDNDQDAVQLVISRMQLSMDDPKYVFRHRTKHHFTETAEDIKCLNEERYPDRTLLKKRLSEFASISGDGIGSLSDSVGGSVDF